MAKGKGKAKGKSKKSADKKQPIKDLQPPGDTKLKVKGGIVAIYGLPPGSRSR